jgi:dolichyl-phosphate beta-glucosyltransferase
MNPYLSVIIPAFNERERIEMTLRSIDTYLCSQAYSYELIVVDDGSSDGTTKFVQAIQPPISWLKVIQLPINIGKGGAVKEGMRVAKGEARLFMDADGSTPIEEVAKLLPHLSSGFEVIVSSRVIMGARKNKSQSVPREILGWIYRQLVRHIVRIDVLDPQNGFKLFSQQSAENIFPSLRIYGWSFDVEVLVLAKKMGYKIKEVPIVWTNDERSRVRLMHIPRMFFDMLSLTSQQFLKFCVVGVLNTGVDFSIYYLLSREFWTFASSIHGDKAASYLVATLCSFVVNRYWTFTKFESINGSEIIRFYTTVGMGIFVNVGVQYIVVTLFNFNDLLGVLIASLFTALWGFAFAKFFVFKK